MNDLRDVMQRELCCVMETKVPRCVLAQQDSAPARLAADFGLRRRVTYASLCMCALVESCLKGNVPAIKQAIGLVGGGAVDEGLLGSLDLERLLGEEGEDEG